ncbi:MAG: MFS transporter, partial [Dongiaceae bacterium]
PLISAWRTASGFPDLLAVALCLGFAGASFAVALPLAGRWYPAEHQGLAMGIAAAGNSGTVIAAFFAPRFAEVFGWRGVFGLAMIPVSVVLALFYFLARESPSRPAPRQLAQYLTLAAEPDTWWFSLLYMVSFGGFVGLASFLPIFFSDQYGASRIAAGNLTALSVFAGSFARPVGGYLADRVGGIRLLTVLFGVIGALYLAVAALPPLPLLVPLIFVIMSGLGIGNGAVFQLVPQRFGRDLGLATGLVGAAGGLGGFLLPSLIGGFRDWSGSYSTGFILFAAAAMSASALLVAVERGWRREWARDDLEVAF